MSTYGLDSLFAPASVAVVGASPTPGTIGRVVVDNLLEGGFAGPILPVNPKHRVVRGILAYARAADLPLVPELAVLCTPPRATPGVLRELAELGTRAAVVLTAGLATERDAGGRALDEVVGGIAREARMRLLGPNCVGLLAPHAGLNASFAPTSAPPGGVAFASQSGALCTAVLDWARERRIGFSAFVSLGDVLDVDFGDVIDYLGADPRTRAILLYLESVTAPRKFLSATRAAARNKPVVALKAGRVPEGERAAASHTRALAGSDAVFEAALTRAGVLRVSEFGELFDAAETLVRAGPVLGSRLAILTNGGGPGVLATDALVAGGGTLARLAPATLAALDGVLPPTWSRANPIDLIGDADGRRYARALRLVAADPGVDALLVLHAPVAVASGLEIARAIVQEARHARAKVLTSFLGGESARAGRAELAAAGIATYETPGAAVQAFLRRLAHRRAQELLAQVPSRSLAIDEKGGSATARELLREREGWLTQSEALAVLAAFGLPVARARVARDGDEAVAAARELGYPVALKVLSERVVHKTDVGGVQLDLASDDDVRRAAAAIGARVRQAVPGAEIDGFVVQEMVRRPDSLELFVGSSVDPVFGPFVAFGQGGTAVEVVGDVAVALPPLDLVLAEECMGRTRIRRLLDGWRGRPPVDLEAVRGALVRVSQLVVECPEVVELDVNPLLASPSGVIALDARILVQPARARATDRLAIRPYPREEEEEVELPAGRRILVRPIRPEDEPAHRRLLTGYRPQDLRFRFFRGLRELPRSELARATQIDYDREMAFIALAPGAPDEALGVVRSVRDPAHTEAVFAIVVASGATGQGVGRVLLEKAIRYWRAAGVGRLVGRVRSDNARMLQLAASLGFAQRPVEDSQELEILLSLNAPPA